MNIEKIREALIGAMEIVGYKPVTEDDFALLGEWRELAKQALAALSTIDPEAIRREVCDRLLKVIESVPYSDKKREGTSAYDDAIDECCGAVNAEIASILGAEPAQEESGMRVQSTQCRKCLSYDVCTRPELSMAFHKCDGFEPAQDDGKDGQK